MRVASVVEKNTASCNAMLSPVVNGALVVCRWSGDVRTFGAIVKRSGGDMGKVTEPVPLSSGLRVQVVQIIVCNTFGQSLDLVFERLTAERWLPGTFKGRLNMRLVLYGGSCWPIRT